MDIIIQQEIALHQDEIRQNKAEVVRLLHPSFRETGRSGNCYDYANIIKRMTEEIPSKGSIHSQDYECIQIEPSVQLLLYGSVSVDEHGQLSHFTKRSSIWVLSGTQWQMKYHQGTACEPFELKESCTYAL